MSIFTILLSVSLEVSEAVTRCPFSYCFRFQPVACSNILQKQAMARESIRYNLTVALSGHICDGELSTSKFLETGAAIHRVHRNQLTATTCTSSKLNVQANINLANMARHICFIGIQLHMFLYVYLFTIFPNTS